MRIKNTSGSTIDLTDFGLGSVLNNGILDVTTQQFATIPLSVRGGFTDIGPVAVPPAQFIPFTGAIVSALPATARPGEFVYNTGDSTFNLGQTDGTWLPIAAADLSAYMKLDGSTPVTGASQFNADVDIDGNVDVSGTSNLVGAVTVTGALNGNGGVFDPNFGVSRFLYDIADGGDLGTQATHAMRVAAGSRAIPADAVIYGGFMRVLDVPVGTGASVAVTSGEAANDIIAAAAITGAPWSTGGIKAIVPVADDVTKMILTAASRTPSVVISAANLTELGIDLVLIWGQTSHE